MSVWTAFLDQPVWPAGLVEAPERAGVVSVPAGHSPVLVAVSASDPELVWVTARGSNSLLVFDRERLVAGRARALVGVGIAPTGLAVLAGGSRVVVANSNRYGSAEEPQTLTVVDAAGPRCWERSWLARGRARS